MRRQTRSPSQAAPAVWSARIYILSPALLIALAVMFALLPTSSPAAVFGGFGTGAGQFFFPVSATVNQATGDLYVGDSTAQRVSKFDSEGNFLLAFGWGVRDGSEELQTCTTATTCTVPLKSNSEPVSGSAAGQFSYPRDGIAVDSSTGDVYVVDTNNDRVQKFTSSGEFILMFGGEVDKTTGADICTGASGDLCGAGVPGTANGYFSPFRFRGSKIAIGSGGAVYVADQSRIQRFEPDGAYAGQLDLPVSRPIAAIAIGSSGDFYVQEEPPETAEAEARPIKEFDPSGVFLRAFDASGFPQAYTPDGSGGLFVWDGTRGFIQYDSNAVQTEWLPLPEGVKTGEHDSGALAYDAAAEEIFAVDGENHRIVEFQPPPPGPLVESFSTEATNVLAETAAVRSSVNPEGRPTTFHFEYGLSNSYGQSTTESGPVGSDFSFHGAFTELNDLQPGSTYHFRIVASNSAGTIDGPDQTLVTPPPLLLNPQPPAAVTPTSATLRAYLNPLATAATFRFEYGTSAGYGVSTEGVDAGAGTEFVSAEAPIVELQPNTVYHYRVVGHDSFGDFASPDLTFSTPPSQCPNESLRQEDSSLALPDCRAYEKVSPADKGDYGVGDVVVADADGERALYSAQGNFAGATYGPLDAAPDYLAHRTAGGWITDSIFPPLAFGYPHEGQPITWSTADLGQFATEVLRPANSTAEDWNSTSGTIYLRRPDGSFAPGSPVLQRVDGLPLEADEGTPPELCGASADLSHLLVCATDALLPSDPLPHNVVRLYEVVGANTASPLLRLTSLDNSGNLLVPCQPTFLTPSTSASKVAFNASRQDAVSQDGQTIFFSTESSALPGGCGITRVFQVLARRGGVETVDLSQPSPSECGGGSAPTEESCRNAPRASADFVGSRVDGSRAFFLSAQQLTDDASEDPRPDDGVSQFGTDQCNEVPQGTGCNLYMYDFNRPAGHHLVDLSAGDTSGLGPRVRGVLRISPDGSSVYFVARGVLTQQPNARGGIARPGAENLYVADLQTGSLTFLADLCTGAERSGALSGLAQCPGSGDDLNLLRMGSANSRPESPFSYLTPDGRFLVFTTYAQLTPDDTNQAADVYRYDAQTGSLVRVSVGHDGFDQNGNGGGQDAIVDTHVGSGPLGSVPRLASDDGSTIVFTTARPLQEGDVNGVQDVYEWHQGEVTLLSGSSNEAIDTAVVSSSGRDVFFATPQGLLPQDTDGLRDLYDARVGGGFPLPGQGPPICETPEGCGRQAGPEPPPPTQGSASLQHGPEEPAKPCRKGFVKRHGHCVKAHHHHRRKAHHHKRSHKRAASHERGGVK